MDSLLSRRLTRLLCFELGDRSFAKANRALAVHHDVDFATETGRVHGHAAAKRLAAWAETTDAARKQFQKALADPPTLVEMQADAGKVRTRELTDKGWRDFKVVVFGARATAEPATPAEYATRQLPPPKARFGFVKLESIAPFAARWPGFRARLGLEATPIHVLGDGAEWLWNAVPVHLPESEECLDIFHASGYVADAAAALHGAGTAAAKARHEAGRLQLLEGGWQGACQFVADEHAAAGPADAARVQGACDPMLTYFSKHVGRMRYRERMAEGRAIGSGMIEGSVKTVALRLKLRGARWKLGNVDGIANLALLNDSTLWDSYWTTVT